MTRQQRDDIIAGLPKVMTWDEAKARDEAGTGEIWTAYVGGYGYRQHFCVGDAITHIYHNMRQQFEAVR